jgi:hypothetical protein
VAEKTTNYKQFKVLEGNRPVSAKHVKNLAASIAKNNLLEHRPIKVNEQMEVIDGQHRLAAATMLGVPVFYEKAEGIGLEDAIILNETQMNWSLIDYARSYAARGNKHYQTFLDFSENYKGLPVYLLRDVLTANISSSGLLARKFKAGEFVVKVEPEQAEVIIDQLLDIANYMPSRLTKSNYAAISKVTRNEAYDHDRMTSQLAKYGEGLLTGYGSVNDIIRQLEMVYNSHKTEDNKVRFF